MKLLEPTFPVFKPNLNPYIPQNKIESLREFSECIFLPFSRGLQNAKKNEIAIMLFQPIIIYFTSKKKIFLWLDKLLADMNIPSLPFFLRLMS